MEMRTMIPGYGWAVVAERTERNADLARYAVWEYGPGTEGDYILASRPRRTAPSVLMRVLLWLLPARRREGGHDAPSPAAEVVLGDS